jgi:hypothetical protein
MDKLSIGMGLYEYRGYAVTLKLTVHQLAILEQVLASACVENVAIARNVKAPDYVRNIAAENVCRVKDMAKQIDDKVSTS